MIKLSIIVAYDINRCIGLNGGIPWDLPEDRKFFREITNGYPIIMGWNTWKSLDYKPLKNRKHIILTRSNKIPIYLNHTIKPFIRDWPIIRVCNNIEKSIEIAQEYSNEAFVIGGSQIYQEFLSRKSVHRVIASEINREYLGDTFFPELSKEFGRPNLLREYDDFKVVEYLLN